MNIKELRIREGLSQSAMAEKLGIAASAISHLENGRMKVSTKIAAKVKEVFGVDVDNEKIEVKKPVVKTTRKAKETTNKVKKAPKAKAAKLEIIIQSPLGGNITADEIAAKIPVGAESVFVRVDQNKLWWTKGEETGAVDIW